MIEEVKKILVEDLQLKYDMFDKELKEKMNVIDSLKSELWSLEEKTQYPVVIKHFSFIQRVLTKRNEYKNYKTEEEQYNHDSKKAEEIRAKISILEKELKELKLNEKVQNAQSRLDEAKSAKIIKELGLDVFSAIKLLNSRGIPIVLTEADKVVTEVETDYSSKSTLIGVHKTRFAPVGSIIKTAKDAKAMKKQTITINNQEFEYEFMSERDTVHMAMNDEVSSHMFGSWEDCEYAVLIPMADIPNEKIGYTSSVDTFTKGSLTLSQNSWILCPLNQVEKIKSDNPDVHVIGYEGKSVLGYSKPFLTTLGYRGENVSMWSWTDDKSARKFADLMEKENLPMGAHSYTYFAEDEEILTDINATVSICKTIKDNGLLKSEEDIDNISGQLIDDFIFSSTIEILGSGSYFDNGEYPDAIKGNHRDIDIFFSKLKEDGIFISDNYRTIFGRISQTGIGNIDAENIEDLFQGLSDLTEDEKLAKEELKNSLLSCNDYYERDERNKCMTKFMTKAICNGIVRSKERITTNELDTEQADDLDR